jgi:hypothetical protein
LPANTPAIVANGKPLVLYVGAEYCPYCAAERWALVTALSRFGTFSGLGATKSSSTDTAANTNTFDFYHSSYQSRYIEFQPVELSTNTPNPTGSGYTALQKLTPTQKVLVSKYGPSGGSIPFVLVSNKLAIQGASFSPGLLAGLSWSDIAAGLSDPSNPVSQSVLATSNYISAGICAASGAQPAAVCNSPGVQSASKALKIG